MITIEVPRGIIPDECMDEFSKITREALDESSNPESLAKAMQEMLNDVAKIPKDLPIREKMMRALDIAERIEGMIESGEFEEDETLSEDPAVSQDERFDIVGHMDAWRRKHHNVFKNADIFWKMYNDELARVI